MKRFAMILLAGAALVGGIGVASAQMHHGGGGGAGVQHGGGNFHGGGFHGGGGFHHGGHGRVFIGVGFGAPWWGWGWGWPGYYPYYPAYYPAYPGYADYPYSYDYSAPAYIQQDAPAYTDQRSFNPGGNYSYYCPDPAGYYPQVSTCAQGWMRVLPPGAPGPAAPAPR